MFSLKKLLLLSVAFIGATSAAPVDSGSDSLAVRASTPSAIVPKAVDLSAPGGPDVDKRDTSRTRLFWSPQGRFLFMMNLGSKVPQALIDAFSGVGEAGPGKVSKSIRNPPQRMDPALGYPWGYLYAKGSWVVWVTQKK